MPYPVSLKVFFVLSAISTRQKIFPHFGHFFFSTLDSFRVNGHWPFMLNYERSMSINKCIHMNARFVDFIDSMVRHRRGFLFEFFRNIDASLDLWQRYFHANSYNWRNFTSYVILVRSELIFRAFWKVRSEGRPCVNFLLPFYYAVFVSSTST